MEALGENSFPAHFDCWQNSICGWRTGLPVFSLAAQPLEAIVVPYQVTLSWSLISSKPARERPSGPLKEALQYNHGNDVPSPFPYSVRSESQVPPTLKGRELHIREVGVTESL